MKTINELKEMFGPHYDTWIPSEQDFMQDFDDAADEMIYPYVMGELDAIDEAIVEGLASQNKLYLHGLISTMESCDATY